MKKFLLFTIFLIILLQPVFSQEEGWYLDKTIVDIRFKNLRTVSENELRALLREYIGVKFTENLSWEILSILYGLDYFDFVETQVLPGDDTNNTIILDFHVQEKPFIDDIRFIGNQRVRRHELLDVILLTPNDLLNNTLVNSDMAAIKQLYLDEGFMDAVVELRKEENTEEGSVNLYFEIEEGFQTKVSSITIEGNVFVEDADTLIKLMETKPQSFFNKGLFSERLLQEDVLLIESYYHERGFIDAEVIEVRRELELVESENVKQLALTLVIEEGISYEFSGVTIEGNNLYSDEELIELVKLNLGEEVNLSIFEQNFLSIMDLYHSNGYIYNSFDYQELRDEENQTIAYNILIQERERAHIESISITGNGKTREYIIRRELSIEVGDVFSKQKLQAAVMNLYNTGFFEVVNPMPYEGSEDLLMDLQIDVVEARTADIMMGITFSGGAGFPISGQVKWGDANFLGTGKNISVDSTFSLDRASLSLRYNEPWLFGVRWAGGFNLSYNYANKGMIAQDSDGNGVPDPYISWADYEDASNTVPDSNHMEYDSHSISGGFNTGYTWHFPWARIGISGGLTTGFQYIDYDSDVFMPYSENLVENHQTWQYFDRVNGKLSWDKRNLIYDPTKGYILSQTFTVGGILDQSIRDYLKSVSRVGFYQSLFNYRLGDDRTLTAVLDISSAYSLVFEKPWLDEPIDYSDLGYSIDGMFVGKGWSLRSGGKALWDSSLGIRFPIVPNALTVDTFIDMVGFWSEDEYSQGVQLEDFRFSAGAGMRFANPAFPIGLYMVKKFRFDEDGEIDWNPEPNLVEFQEIGMDLVLAFEIDLY